jgi:hypothetical protein
MGSPCSRPEGAAGGATLRRDCNLAISLALMSALGHSRPGPAGRRSSHFRYAPKATFGHQNAIGRDGPEADINLAIRFNLWNRCPQIRKITDF